MLSIFNGFFILSFVAVLNGQLVPLPLSSSQAPPLPLNFQEIFQSPSIQLNGTEIVDKVLNNIRQNVKILHLDNIQSPDVYFKLNENIVSLTNGSIKGLANIYRVGDVLVNSNGLETKIRSAFAIYNLTSDQDVKIIYKTLNYSEGHVHADVDNVTVYQVYKLSLVTQMLTLDEFELSLGKVTFKITGLGDRLKNDSLMITEIINKTKGPFLKLFSFVFKIFVNVALQAAKAALFSG